MLAWSATALRRRARRSARPNRDLRGRGARAQLGDSATPAEQQALVRRVRQAFGGVVRRQLNLDDEKWTQFQRVDRRFQQQRNQLQRDERETRFALKAAMARHRERRSGEDRAVLDRADAGPAPPRRSARGGAEGAVDVSDAVAARQASGAARAAQSSRRADAAAGTRRADVAEASVGVRRVERAGRPTTLRVSPEWWNW